MMNTMIIILIIYYVIGGLYYGGKFIEYIYSHNELTKDNVNKVGIAGGLYGIFWLPLIVYFVIARLTDNVGYNQTFFDTIAYVLYPVYIYEDIMKKRNKTDNE